MNITPVNEELIKVLYPLLAVEIRKLESGSMRDLSPTFMRSISLRALDLQVESHLEFRLHLKSIIL